MLDAAEVLKRPEVVNAIVATITKAMWDTGISQTAIARVGLGFRQRIQDGSPFPPAIELVEVIRRLTFEDAAEMVNFMREDGDEVDLRAVRDRLLRYAKSGCNA